MSGYEKRAAQPHSARVAARSFSSSVNTWPLAARQWYTIHIKNTVRIIPSGAAMDEQEFRARYPTTPTTVLAEELRLSTNAIRLRASRLDISKDRATARAARRQASLGRVMSEVALEKLRANGAARQNRVQRNCPHCGRTFAVAASVASRYQFCSHTCRVASKRSPEAFWERVDRSGEDCWPWKSGSPDEGYGAFKMDGRTILAHRRAWEITYGAIPDGALVLHRCDNRRCCRPEHLFLGSYHDNAQDMVGKDRHLWGDRNPRSRLSAGDVLEIDRLIGAKVLTLDAIARRFRVSRSTVSAIKQRIVWKPLLTSHTASRPHPGP